MPDLVKMMMRRAMEQNPSPGKKVSVTFHTERNRDAENKLKRTFQEDWNTELIITGSQTTRHFTFIFKEKMRERMKMAHACIPARNQRRFATA